MTGGSAACRAAGLGAAAGPAVAASQVDTGDDASVRQLVAAGWGRIINVSGLAALSTGSVIGSIRNVAVSAMTKNLADELGPSGVNVNAVHPGLTRTEATPGVIAAQAAASGKDPAEIERRMAGRNLTRTLIDARLAMDRSHTGLRGTLRCPELRPRQPLGRPDYHPRQRPAPVV